MAAEKVHASAEARGVSRHDLGAMDGDEEEKELLTSDRTLRVSLKRVRTIENEATTISKN
ncbi:unnamed protein product [Prunus armeniaca]|uniref:Uncharacterized protein n=1 Tax=Prunus armeniaca TaxID=36596 RepID=A0A6J5UGU7_PRUAR|nr:unnamed protein product [Prunus armeniaca]CAB4304069.1 unnamed protein product [Prunus armeniaca]